MSIPPPVNEPVLSYAPGTPERGAIRAAIAALRADAPELGLVIGGRDVTTGVVREVREPHAHRRVLARWHAAGAGEAQAAIDAALAARAEWASWTLEQRAAVFLRAADLLAGPWRAGLNAATMLGQSKTVQQAEIDSACEIVDFLRFNASFAQDLSAQQPISSQGVWNRLELRPLDGFVFAVSPFNFTAIGANLPSAPALMGNTVVWKPASTAVVSAHTTMRLLQAAGLPDGVINLVPGDAAAVAGACIGHADLAGLHFTGSTEVFQGLWREIGQRIASYRTYPRVVGETGGKNFVVVHRSAEPAAVATALVRGAYEYQGQKCSAASRAYIPASLWDSVFELFADQVGRIRMGDVADLGNFMGALIDQRAHRRLTDAIALARSSSDAEILLGGGTDDAEGWFVEPTLIRTTDPSFELMQRELFGPVLVRVRVSRRPLRGDPRPVRPDVAVRAHRVGVRPRARCDRAGAPRAAVRRRQLLRQRQADRRRRRPAAVRRLARVRHERQGGLAAQPCALGLGAHGQGDVRSSDRLRLPVPRSE